MHTLLVLRVAAPPVPLPPFRTPNCRELPAACLQAASHHSALHHTTSPSPTWNATTTALLSLAGLGPGCASRAGSPGGNATTRMSGSWEGKGGCAWHLWRQGVGKDKQAAHVRISEFQCC